MLLCGIEYAMNQRPTATGAIGFMLRDLFPIARSRKEIAIVMLLAAFTSAIASWAAPIQYPGAGLDPSWSQALVDATEKGRVFGKDIIFTYGPLHQAITSQASNNLTPLIFSRFAFSFVWFFAQASIGMLFGWRTEASVALATFISTGQSGDANFYLLALVGIIAPSTIAFRLRSNLSNHRAFLSGTILTGLLLATLVKLSYIGSLIPVLMMTIGLQVIEVWEKRDASSIIRLIMLLLCPFLILCIAWGLTSGWSPSDLYTYYFGVNLQIIKGYTDAMSLSPSPKSLLLISIYVFALVVLFFFIITLLFEVSVKDRFTEIAKNQHYLLTMACLTILSWVVFKSSFVRDDTGHTLLGALWITSLFVLIVGFSGRKLSKSVAGENGEFVALSLILPLILSGTLGILSGYRLSAGILLAYVRGFFDSLILFSAEGRIELAQKRMQALGKIRETSEEYKIPDGATADIIPWDISNLVARKLEYTPRPIPQSYSVYTQELQDINRKFFATPKRSPEWLIVDIKDIDGRLPIGLDSPVLASISNGYLFSHRGSEGSLIFKKRQKTMPKNQSWANNCKSITKGSLNWSRISGLTWISKPVSIPLEWSRMVVLNVNINSSLTRSILSSLYRPFPVTIEYLNEAGSVLASYRYIPKASRGLIVYPIVTSNDEFLNLLQPQGDKIGGINRQVSSFRFLTRNIGFPFSRSDFELFTNCGNQ